MKKICILTINMGSGEAYRQQLNRVFGNLIEVELVDIKEYLHGYALNNVDLLLLFKNVLLRETDFEINMPIGVPVVDMAIDFTRETVDMLKAYPNGTKCLFINVSELFTSEAISRLQQLGVYNMQFVPAHPAMEWIPDVDLAITPGEIESVPKGIREVIDIGYRQISPSTMYEIALKLKMEYVTEWDSFQSYSAQFEKNQFRTQMVMNRELQLNDGFEILSEIVREAVIGINEYAKIFCFNRKASELLSIDREEVIGANIYEKLPFSDIENIFNLTSPRENITIRYQDADVNASIYPLVNKDRSMGFLLIVHGFIEEEGKKRIAKRRMMLKGHFAKYTFDQILGHSQAICNAKELALKMARTEAAVLITGESGTGKELFASAIHNASRRAEGQFVAISCSSIPESLLESELLGYESGAFTGAKKEGKPGLFEIARGGTLFLDEVEDMSLRLQGVLLRILQEKEVMRIGGTGLISVDVRVIAATNQGLEKMMREGKIRKDLFFRLCTLQLTLPPLRERREDIPVLIEGLRRRDGAGWRMTEEAMKELCARRWEGNVRELQNYIELFHCLDKKIVECSDLPPEISTEGQWNGESKTVATATDNPCLLKTDKGRFVMGELYEAHRRRTPASRKGIAEAAERKGMLLSEQEVRAVLKQLEAQGWVTVGTGRAGSRLTQAGLRLWNTMLENGENGETV